MPTNWYQITVTGDTLVTVNGYFRVDNASDIVTEFYQTINGTTDFTNNILLAAGRLNNHLSIPNIINDNYFNPTTKLFSNGGIFITGNIINNNNNVYGMFLNGIINIGDINYKGYVKFTQDTGYYTTIDNFDYVINYVSDPTVPSCFNEGTKILCLNKQFEEEYIPVENLRKGDLVKSYKHGYRKIELIGKNSMINNPDIYYECMYKMDKTDSNGLIDDLFLTGAHSVLVDDLQYYQEYREKVEKIFNEALKIDDKYLLLSAFSKDFVKMENNDEYTYYHFCLENNENDNEIFGVWSNGILTETTSKNNFTKQNYILL